MAVVEVVCALEQEFKIKITDKEAENSQTVREIVELVWKKVKENANPLTEQSHSTQPGSGQPPPSLAP